MKIRDWGKKEQKQVDPLKETSAREIPCVYCRETFGYNPSPKGEKKMFVCKEGRGRFWVSFPSSEEEAEKRIKRATEED